VISGNQEEVLRMVKKLWQKFYILVVLIQLQKDIWI
jgi:hypothetical protein